jgi:Cys-rich protein (TIGR01571 family)
MALRFVSLALGVWCVAADGQISADFDKACQAGQQDCVDISDDMYLIQKKIEVGSSTIQTKEKGNKKHAAKKNADVDVVDDDVKGDGDVVTTKDGNEDGPHGAFGSPTCPWGFEPRPGQTNPKELFGQAPESVATTKDKCAEDCNNHTTCEAFEFDEDATTCYLSTERSPRSEFPATDGTGYTFCAKIANCTFVLPWAYWNKTESVEVNAWTAWNTVHRCSVPWFLWCLLSWAIWSLLALLISKVAFGPEPDVVIDPEDPVKTWEEGHFECCRRPKICCCSFFCPAVQWANTMHLAGFQHMGTALIIYLLLAFWNGFFTPIPGWDMDGDLYLTGTGWFPTGIYTSILMLFFRQKLRSRVGRYADTTGSWFFDCCYVLWCPCCAIAQEAMVVQYSFQMGRKEPAVRSSVPAEVRSGRVVTQVPSTGQTLRPTTQPDLRGAREWNY